MTAILPDETTTDAPDDAPDEPPTHVRHWAPRRARRTLRRLARWAWWAVLVAGGGFVLMLAATEIYYGWRQSLHAWGRESEGPHQSHRQASH